ncbi:MAG: hypothetical protein J3K34DRAFT_516714 [Monoraphidium minutum]|nr:MAG: hypothetical protein J3K34DRAFT_516714 [Monoraphidium minutum]
MSRENLARELRGLRETLEGKQQQLKQLEAERTQCRTRLTVLALLSKILEEQAHHRRRLAHVAAEATAADAPRSSGPGGPERSGSSSGAAWVAGVLEEAAAAAGGGGRGDAVTAAALAEAAGAVPHLAQGTDITGLDELDEATLREDLARARRGERGAHLHPQRARAGELLAAIDARGWGSVTTAAARAELAAIGRRVLVSEFTGATFCMDLHARVATSNFASKGEAVGGADLPQARWDEIMANIGATHDQARGACVVLLIACSDILQARLAPLHAERAALCRHMQTLLAAAAAGAGAAGGAVADRGAAGSPPSSLSWGSTVTWPSPPGAADGAAGNDGGGGGSGGGGGGGGGGAWGWGGAAPLDALAEQSEVADAMAANTRRLAAAIFLHHMAMGAVLTDLQLGRLVAQTHPIPVNIHKAIAALRHHAKLNPAVFPAADAAALAGQQAAVLLAREAVLAARRAARDDAARRESEERKRLLLLLARVREGDGGGAGGGGGGAAGAHKGAAPAAPLPKAGA